MSRTICFFLLIFSYIFLDGTYINGQFIQSKPPQYACVPQNVLLTCMNNYAIVVKSAFYGVAQLSGSCTYTPGDCVADAMSIIACLTDSITCTVFASRSRLSQCNDEYSNYFQIEYDCVPLIMNDPAKEYNVCQNGTAITSDHGVLRSPGYPTQFQATTAECILAINAPNDKIIRLWLTDLYIASSSMNCADDHVVVVDSIQTHKHCGRKRYTFPYLCSSTIIIQYFVTTELSIYKGMRMYFETVNRPANDNCSSQNITVTPVPDKTITPFDLDRTTTSPTYVLLGIASPVISFQLCKVQSRSIECPNGFGIAIKTNIFGVTQSDQCEPYDPAEHCVIKTEPTLICKQRCTYLYSGNRNVSSCNNKIATYQYVEYQCIPTNTEIISPNTLCPTNGSKTSISINRRGRFQNYNYPTLQPMDCIYRLKANLGDIMHIYSLDISLNDYTANCGSNKVSFIEDDDQGQSADFCEQRAYALIYSSCSNELDLRYIVQDDSKTISNGAELYIETQLRPLDWSCVKPISPATNSTTTFTLPTTTSNNTPLPIWAQNLHLSPILSVHVCLGTAITLRCPRSTDYVLAIIDSSYGVTGTGLCGIPSPSHCHQEVSLGLTCTQSCLIEYNISKPLVQCGMQNADYLQIDYQCIPTRLPNNENPIDVCSLPATDVIATSSGMMISPRYPTLDAEHTCSKTIETLKTKLWMIYIVDLFLERENNFGQCNNSSLTIYDGINKFIRCGLHQPNLVLISCSNIVQFSFISSHQALGYRGFKVYFTAVEAPDQWTCIPTGFITTTANYIETTTAGHIEASTSVDHIGATTAVDYTAASTTVGHIEVATAANYTAASSTVNYTVAPTTTADYATAPTTIDHIKTTTAAYIEALTTVDNIEATATVEYTTATTTASHIEVATTANYTSASTTIGHTEVATTSDNTPLPIWAQNLHLSPILSVHVCLGTAITLRCPRSTDYVLAIIDSSYGVTGTSLCEIPSPSHCHQEVSLGLTCTQSCLIEYNISKPLVQCGMQNADYLQIDYQCIPTRLPNNENPIDVCSLPATDVIATSSGMMISPRYPTLDAEHTCSKTIETLKTKLWMIYIVDLFLQGENNFGQCNDSSLTIYDGINKFIRCGLHQPNLVLISCSNIVQFSFISSHQALGYRGFKVYFTAVEAPDQWTCIPTSLITTTTVNYFEPNPKTNSVLIIALSAGLGSLAAIGIIGGLFYYVKVIKPKKKIIVRNNEIPTT